MADAYRVVAVAVGGQKTVVEDNLLLADAQTLQMRTIIAGRYESAWVEPDTREPVGVEPADSSAGG
ncbi:MAG: hypothetical protein ACT4QC_23630 [Planctomycetaceae bacterium]